MSYAVRNTIILLVTLTLFVGAAYSYIQFFQISELERLQTLHTEKQKDYNTKRATADDFPELNETYQNALSVIENYNKSLFKSPNPDRVYDYLNYISNSDTNSKVYFDFNYVDSTAQNQYGIVRAEINGYGTYSNLVNFINKLENSQLLNKVIDLTLAAPGNNEDLNDISFSFTVESYYERIPIQDNLETTDRISMDPNISTYNPFFPLIQPTVPLNVDNLIDVEKSRLIGIAGSRIFIVDQGGNVTSLREGDTVYLGELESIDLSSKSATFKLNKGGITELVTLEIQR